MTRYRAMTPSLALAMAISMLPIGTAAHNPRTAADQHPDEREPSALVPPITVRPWTLSAFVEELAGQSVRLPRARIVEVLHPRVLIVESETPMRSMMERHRVLVFVEAGIFRTDPALLADSTVTISGTARTLSGLRVDRNVPWPTTLTDDDVERFEIRAAVLARSVQTPDGIELLASS